jgi:hypothetical protein
MQLTSEVCIPCAHGLLSIGSVWPLIDTPIDSCEGVDIWREDDDQLMVCENGKYSQCTSRRKAHLRVSFYFYPVSGLWASGSYSAAPRLARLAVSEKKKRQ